ncbi:MAG: zf-HC2 domain-containing protein, partial [bacterium]|nr:zf-HC2 domain-containing protein [bacterium]
MSDDVTRLSGDPHDLVAGFALDALDPDESQRFAEHLPICESCRAELDALTETATTYGSSTRITPPAELEDRLM